MLGGGALLLFAVGTNVQAGWVLAIAALLLGILIAGLVLPLSALSRVEVTRRVARTTAAGQPLPATLTVANVSRGWRGLFRVRDEFCGTGWAFVDAVAPGSRHEFIGTRTDVRRGVYTGGTCTLESGAPFGVLGVRRSVSVSSPLVVHPRVVDVSDRLLGGVLSDPAATATEDVSSVRDYRPGDPLRHIHWRSAAKRGQLVVREFDREQRAEGAVIALLPDDPDTGDAVASVACSLAIAMLREGDVRLVGVVQRDARGPGELGARRARSPHAVLDWGARLGAGELHLADAVARLDRSTRVICVAPASRMDVDTLARLASGARVFAAVIASPSDDAASDVLAALRAAGVPGAEVGTDAVESWLSGAVVA